MARHRALIANVRKIAVLRANAIGDFVFALPALIALRAAYPAAELVLLALDWHRIFLQGRPGPIDRVVVLPPVAGVSAGSEQQVDEARVAAFVAAMREEGFDLALQMHGGGRHSNPLLRRLGARVTAGLQADDAAALDRTLPYVYFQSEIVRYLEMVGLVGAAPLTLDPQLQLTPADRTEARALVAEGDRPLALLHPGASDARRRWSLDRFVAVGQALCKSGAHVLVSGVESERELCERLAGALPGAQNLCGHVSLGGLLGVLARCAVVVSNDSGPLHLAAAVDTPSVGIYWCFNLVNSSQLTRARHRPFASWRIHCPVCGRDCTNGRCDHPISFVDEVGVDEVRDAALSFLPRDRSAAA